MQHWRNHAGLSLAAAAAVLSACAAGPRAPHPVPAAPEPIARVSLCYIPAQAKLNGVFHAVALAPSSNAADKFTSFTYTELNEGGAACSDANIRPLWSGPRTSIIQHTTKPEKLAN